MAKTEITKEAIEKQIDEAIAEGKTILQIAEDYQNAYKQKLISEQIFFTARKYYMKKAGLNF